MMYVAVLLALQITTTLEVIDKEREHPVVQKIDVLHKRTTGIAPSGYPTRPKTAPIASFVFQKSTEAHSN